MATRAARSRRPRRRRRPDEAEREILDAAEALFARRPVHTVTIDEVMAETGLSRQAFYAYFRDRHHLIARVVTRLAARRDEALAGWEGPTAPDPIAASRAELTRLARFYLEHGDLLRALAEGAHRDQDAAEAWSAYVESVVAVIAARIKEGVETGLVSPFAAPEETARALCWMNNQYLLERFLDRRDRDVDAAVEVLHEIWKRSILYAPVPDDGGS
jgi:AcrR family transcriptional regulator